MKTHHEIYRQKQRIFRLFMEKRERGANRADPRTGGHDLYVHNWGNEVSKQFTLSIWAHYRRIEVIADRMYSRAVHREHINENYFDYLWCEHCNLKRKGGRNEKLLAEARRM